MKKIFVFLIVLSMLLTSTLTGCKGKEKEKEESVTDPKKVEEVDTNFNATGLPIVNEPVTLTVAGGKGDEVAPFDELLFYTELEKMTNVKIDWQMVPKNVWVEKRSLLMASKTLPDIFYGQGAFYGDMLMKYASQGLIRPLDDLIEKYGVNIKKVLEDNPDYKKALTAPDGHIYSLPKMVAGEDKLTNSALFINQKWLKKLNLEVPTTMEEYYAVLKAFKDNDPNGNGKPDEIPLTFRFENGLNGIYPLFGAFGRIDTKTHMLVEDGKVVYTAIEPEYKDAIAFFHNMFKDGLIDQESFTQDKKVFRSKAKSKERIVGSFLAWDSSTWKLSEEDDEYIAIPPFKNQNGEQLWEMRTQGGRNICQFAISAQSENAEAAFRWADMQYDDDIALQAAYGMFGKGLEKIDENTIKFIESPDGKTKTEIAYETAPGKYGLYGLSSTNKARVEGIDEIAEKDELDKVYEPYLEPNYYPNLLRTKDEITVIAELQVDIATYTNEMYSKWMVNGGIEDEWDGYLKILKNMRLDEILKVYQDGLDRYNSN